MLQRIGLEFHTDYIYTRGHQRGPFVRCRGRPLPHRRHAPAERRQHPSPDFQAPAALQARLSAGPDRGDRCLDGTRRPRDNKREHPPAAPSLSSDSPRSHHYSQRCLGSEFSYFKALNPLLYVALNLHCRFPLSSSCSPFGSPFAKGTRSRSILARVRLSYRVRGA